MTITGGVVGELEPGNFLASVSSLPVTRQQVRFRKCRGAVHTGLPTRNAHIKEASELFFRFEPNGSEPKQKHTNTEHQN